jgi:NAD(P)-dependent dehydrogenase (short-subunit alcohol dehydrogenase family)
MISFQDKVIVVTGAGGGIGSACVILFESLGGTVVSIDRNLKNAYQCDIAARDEVETVATTIHKTYGKIDVLVNNAGVLRAGALATISSEDWNLLLTVNLNGTLNCSQAFGKFMLERGQGALVHVASIAGTEPQGNSGAYSAAKAAILMLSKQLAFEWGSRGVRSNTISPGLVRTPMSESFYQAEGVLAKREAVVPLRRIGTPHDMANAIAFLASDAASYITGQDLIIDGGFGATLMSHVPRPGF